MWKKAVAFWKRNRIDKILFGLLLGWLLYFHVLRKIPGPSKPMDAFFLAIEKGDIAGVKQHYPLLRSLETPFFDILTEENVSAKVLSRIKPRFQFNAPWVRMPMPRQLNTLRAIDLAAQKFQHTGKNVYFDIVKYLASKGARIQPGLFYLVGGKNIKTLLPYAEHFSTPEAVLTGDVAFIRQCLRGKIDNFYLCPYPNMDLQRRSIEAAISLNRPDIVLMLHREAGYPITGNETFYGLMGYRRSILIWSIEENHYQVLEVLLRNAKSIQKGILVYAKDVESARLLLRHGARINYPEISLIDRGGFDQAWFNATPIVYAIWAKNLALVKFYVKNGAEINFSFGDKNQSTPLSMAISTGQTAIADYLRSIGAKEKVSSIPPAIKQGRDEKKLDEKRVRINMGTIRSSGTEPVIE